MIARIMYYWAKFCKKIRFKAIYNSEIDNKAHIAAGCHIYKSKVGKYTAIGYDCQIIYCQIGSFCSFASGIIIGGAEHPVSWVSTSQVFVDEKDSINQKFSPHKFETYKTTIIGNDVWIGDRTLIKAGIKISDGAVIGMGSVVTKNVGPYEIWAGNPAKLIRKRFDDKAIAKLLDSRWYDFPEDKIELLAKDFTNISEFLKRIGAENENITH